jgi:hypothetical protein
LLIKKVTSAPDMPDASSFIGRSALLPVARGASVVGRIAIAFTAFLLTAAAIHLALGDPWRLYAEGRSEKIAMLHALRGQIDAVAVGTSRIEEGFDPAVFDAAFADGPYSVASLDLGLPGGSQTEQRAMAEEALRTLRAPDGHAACLLIMELNAGVNFPPEDVLHPRSIDVYDADTIRFAEAFGGDATGTYERLGRLGFALIAGAAHYVNSGMLSAWLFHPGDARNPAAALESRRGQRVTEASAADHREVAEAFAHRGDTKLANAGFMPGNRELLADVAATASASSQILYVVTPKLDDLTTTYVYPDEMNGPAGAVPVINMARPDLYPELYQPRYWRNAGHLDAAGAALFTRLLGQQINLWLASHDTTLPCKR